MRFFILVHFIVVAFIAKSQTINLPVDSITAQTFSSNYFFNMLDMNVNEYFYFYNDTAIRKIVGAKEFKKIFNKHTSGIFFLNKDASEYLRVGLNVMSMVLFESGHNRYYPDKKYQTKFANFKTQNGISLGLPESEFLLLTKKIPYKVITKDGSTIYRFWIKDRYDSIFEFEKGKCVHWAFGLTNFPNI